MLSTPQLRDVRSSSLSGREEATVSRGLTGHLDLLCALDSRGVSTLRRQSFRAPMHLSKPHLDVDSGTLVVNVVNPTAGLLAGDRISCRVEVASGARLLLTSPSASRAHRMASGHAEVSQHFHVAQGGFLETWPELFIPQAGAHHKQGTVLQIDEGAEVLHFELVAPGRVASGESLAFTALEWEMDLILGGKLVARERYRLGPKSVGNVTLRGFSDTPYYASCFVVSPRLASETTDRLPLERSDCAEVKLGGSRIADGVWVFKLLADKSVAFRRELCWLRQSLYTLLGTIPPDLRRA